MELIIRNLLNVFIIFLTRTEAAHFRERKIMRGKHILKLKGILKISRYDDSFYFLADSFAKTIGSFLKSCRGKINKELFSQATHENTF